jgi:hypothetical protein
VGFSYTILKELLNNLLYLKEVILMSNFKTAEELRSFIAAEVINTSEAAEILSCSRQNIEDLIKRNKLIPIKIYPRDKLFLKSDVLQRVKNG